MSGTRKNTIISVSIGVVLLMFLLILSAHEAGSIQAQGVLTVGEGYDFATRVLRDPWDMSEFSDISQYLNQSGQASFLTNIQVANGVFSAAATNTGQANFHVLFPGYLTGIKTGKVGALYPINSTSFHCLDFAMNTQSTDSFRVIWFKDDKLNGTGGVWGGLWDSSVSPNVWKLYSEDLASTPNSFFTSWTGSTTWQGLRIDPSEAQPNVSFSVDWVRLTDCAPVNTTITWSPSASVNAIWVTPSGTTRNILVATGVNGSAGSYLLDTQGLAPGTYQISLGTATTCCTVNANVLTVNQAPIANFTSPSFTSGVDYATQVGNPWDFNDASDVTSYYNISAPAYASGLATFTTASGPPSGADPIIYLNTPQAIPNASTYRYLTFKMNTQYPIQNVPNGMIARWIWRVGTSCELVSQDIPFDVDWQTYSIDLNDSFNGSVEQMGPSGCASPSITWPTSTNVTQLRFDPNENALGQSLTQQLDQIWLTQMNRVASGMPFPAQIRLNKSPSLVPTRTFYYTTNPSNPYQNPAHPNMLRASKPKVGQASSLVFLPFVMNSQSIPTPPPTPQPPPPDPNGVDFLWDTTGVAPGTYYLCAQLSDGINQATYCSEVPIQVY